MKKTNLSVFFILILLVIFSCSKDNELENSNINAQESFVELSQVKKIAEEIYFETKTNSIAGKSNSTKSTKRTIEDINEVKNEKGKISFYVINYNEGGFILLSADKRTEPILGFSVNGKFDIDENSYPLGLKFWIKDAKKQITDIQNSNIEQSEKDKLAWKLVQYAIANSNIFAKEPPVECYEHTVTYTVGPLLSTTWFQTGGFNDAYPISHAMDLICRF
ncbi:MAG: Spi family protease inhibitor [Lutibacter sp.]|nr:Spi family protease inhibitor [Lutibacter sp.]